ncbi:uncharacterized protein LOC125654583 [Ostrea edulis]|uniref:uncharacterized protein LOC125654583 n=1 Tax=Ostrea edulis TaxID=37623 RepID=UPI0024AFAA2D|nr:uncharacterized protein LOC125654583 [Ostrea edulis]
MDPRRSAQYVLLCDYCKTQALQSHCELCQTNLCVICVGKHLSDSSRKHRVVPFIEIGSTPCYPKCLNHAEKQCELYCEKCDIPVCSTCIFSGQHEGHKLSDVMKKLDDKTEGLRKDLEELEARIYPRYEEMASDIQTDTADLDAHYGKLTKNADQQGEVWHQEINTIVDNLKSDIEDMKNKHLAVLGKSTDDIAHSIADLRQIIQDLKKTLESNDLSLVSQYKSRNDEFRRLPPKIQVTISSFTPEKINTDQLHGLFGSLTPLSITTEEHGETIKAPEADSLPGKPLVDKPRLTNTIHTGYEPHSVTCLSDEKVWTSGDSSTMKLFDLQGKQLRSIQANLGNEPGDISVTRGGDLLFTDPKTKTVNIVKNRKIQTMISLWGWTPLNICNTSIGDLLVTMVSDDRKQSKVVRYSGSKETQTIQVDDQGRPLYSSDATNKYISENRNLNICVADNEAKAVVVVNRSGKLRFRYTGHPSNSKESFYPFGITTDSKSQILTADCVNARIHILDKDGQFLRYIDNYDLRLPWGLCGDTRDNLFVAELTGKVKKIKYL